MQPGSVTEPIAAVMRAWVGGWTRSRGTAPAESTDFGLRIQVDDGSESVRRVLLDPTPDRLAAVIAQATEPKACVKFPGGPAQWLPLFPADWQPQDEQWLMTVPLLNPVPEVSPPVGYTVDTTVQPGVVTVSVLDDTGASAASGRAGIEDAVAVPDQISTEAAHRRRGLGVVVMRTLEQLARDQGATRQVLVASPDGRGLYASLGWTLIGPVTAARRA